MTCIQRLQKDGIVRRGSRRGGFRYAYRGGGRVARLELERIANLGLPPAWRDVVIDRSPRARVQAMGRDAAGRWQYIYHPNHVRLRELRKHERLRHFGAALPRLRRAVSSHMRLDGLPREKILATIVRLLACAFIRPGNEIYAAENGSYGIATLRRRHLRVRGDTMFFDFPAKSGKRQRREIRHAGVARTVRQLLSVPGVEVFKYIEGRNVIDVRCSDINQYIKAHMGAAFTAKDFRTWTATLVCALLLTQEALTADNSERARKRAIKAALEGTARQLGNTAAICRSSYVSPCVITAFQRGSVIDAECRSLETLLWGSRPGLHACERALLRMLANGQPARR